LKAIDPLEETVGADDLKRNNCPEHLRITAIHQRDIIGRTTYQTLNSREYKEILRTSGRPRLRLWMEINGSIIETNAGELSEKIGVTWGAIMSAKSKKLSKDKNATEARIIGLRFGWGEPPTI
jgi:hypothetical protein